MHKCQLGSAPQLCTPHLLSNEDRAGVDDVVCPNRTMLYYDMKCPLPACETKTNRDYYGLTGGQIVRSLVCLESWASLHLSEAISPT